MEIQVPYGDGFQKAQIPDDIPVQVICPPSRQDVEPVEQLIREAMDHPVGTPLLEEMVGPGQKITIVVNDHTRPGPSKAMAEEVLRRLKKAGVEDDQIHFVIATGSHRASTEKELKHMLGEEICSQFPIHNHDCQSSDHVYLGATKEGMPIWIDREVVEGGFLITTGLIAPHATAGFSGGRKSIVPGVAGIKTLHIHHSLPIRPFEPAMGYFEENPFHQAALEAARKVGVDFILNMVQDSHKQNIACVAGDLNEAHLKGVSICRRVSSVKVKELADVVIVSPGGTPRDYDLYQAQKALSVGEIFGQKGNCTFILCARGDGGIGEGLFVSWLKEADNPGQVIERFEKEGFNVGNNKAFMYARAMTKGKVVIVSHCLDPKELREMMLDWAPSLQEAIDQVIREKRPRRIAVLPAAVNLIPQVEGGLLRK